MQSNTSHYQVYKFEIKHDCNEECLLLCGTCTEPARSLTSLTLAEALRVPFLESESIPILSNERYFFLQIDFPSSIPIIKLININARAFTVKMVLKEFFFFFAEAYSVEEMTMEETKEEILCDLCLQEDFSRFERTESECFICSSDKPLETIKLDCGHVACKPCLSTWFREKNKCPFCRKPIKPCACGGARSFFVSRPRDLVALSSLGIPSRGIYNFQPYLMNEVRYGSLVYDSYSNVFKLKGISIRY